jgi:hypothetical protein
MSLKVKDTLALKFLLMKIIIIMNSNSSKSKNSGYEMTENKNGVELNNMDFTQFKQAFLYLSNELSELKKHFESVGKNRLNKAMEKWVDGEEVRKALKISKRTLQSYRDTGILGYTQFGNKFFYKVESINDLLEKNYKRNK